jgi:hypothetical protein
MKNIWVSSLAALLMAFDCSAHAQTPRQNRPTSAARPGSS